MSCKWCKKDKGAHLYPHFGCPSVYAEENHILKLFCKCGHLKQKHNNPANECIQIIGVRNGGDHYCDCNNFNPQAYEADDDNFCKHCRKLEDNHYFDSVTNEHYCTI